MVSLVDIVDVKKTATIRGKDIEVEGINAEKLGLLINAFPELRLVFGGRAADLTPQDIVSMGPKIVAAIIASGTGSPGDAAAEAAAAKLTIGEQMTLLTAIFEVTFPDGFGPFVEKLRSLGFIDQDDAPGGFGWGPGTNSQRPPKPLQATAETAASRQS